MHSLQHFLLYVKSVRSQKDDIPSCRSGCVNQILVTLRRRPADFDEFLAAFSLNAPLPLFGDLIPFRYDANHLPTPLRTSFNVYAGSKNPTATLSDRIPTVQVGVSLFRVPIATNPDKTATHSQPPTDNES
jgi:hypothetical protein